MEAMTKPKKVYIGTLEMDGDRLQIVPTVRVGLEGIENPVVVTTVKLLDPQLKIRNHSPTGFAWGYGGSGPAQLALAILVDLVGEGKAFAYYQSFKEAYVAKLNLDQPWILREDEAWQILRSLDGWVE